MAVHLRQNRVPTRPLSSRRAVRALKNYFFMRPQYSLKSIIGQLYVLYIFQTVRGMFGLVFDNNNNRDNLPLPKESRKKSFFLYSGKSTERGKGVRGCPLGKKEHFSLMFFSCLTVGRGEGG